MTYYNHALVVGADDIIRCTVCRAAAYNASIIDGIPCKDGYHRGVAIADTYDYGEIIGGAEPPWPKMGDFWLQANPPLGRDTYWVWTHLGDGVQDWVDLDTGQPRNGENRLPTTEINRAVEEIGVRQECSDEILAQIGEANIAQYITSPLVERLLRDAEAKNMVQVSPIEVATERRTAYDAVEFAARMHARRVHPSIRLHIKNTHRAGVTNGFAARIR